MAAEHQQASTAASCDRWNRLRTPSRIALNITHGPSAGQTLAAKGFWFQIGRTRASKFHIKDAAVSEQHAEIAWDGKNWVLKDVGSSNGTTVNGRVLLPNAEVVALMDGDEVKFGLDSIGQVQIQQQGLGEITVEQLLSAEYSAVAQYIEARARDAAKKVLTEWCEAKAELLKAGGEV